MCTIGDYKDFLLRFQVLVKKRPELIINTLSNIFTMRLIGNKTHGDLAEIGISEFINQFMYDFQSKHVGKDLFRAKKHEEDIVITNELSKVQIPVSLKAYGNGPLQLSTDKDCTLYPFLSERFANRESITDREEIATILQSEQFDAVRQINIMPMIYDEEKKRCNIMIFDYEKAIEQIREIEWLKEDNNRKHPIYRFLSSDKNYIFEVRYGGREANALQRGLWTHTQKAEPYFISITNGWISYEHNMELVKLFSLALNATKEGHKTVNVILQTDISNYRDRK